MAKTIATISGVALAPGVSRNGRLYTREAIARGVERAQERIAAGKRPIAMYTHHDTRNTADIAGGVTKMWQDENGAARYEAKIANTKAGRDIAALADPGPDGDQAVLRGLSIKGDWLGPVRHVRVGGQLADTAEDLEISRLDWTSEPGVDDAGVDSFALVTAGGAEDYARHGICEAAPDALLTITEDVQEARVTAIAEETAPDLDEAAKTAAPPGTTYADPGYLDADGKQVSKSGKPGVKRYPLNNPKRIRAAWSYVNQQANASQYTPDQLKRIKGKIKSAMVKLGAKITAENWSVWPAEQVTESEIAEYSGGTSGSFSVCASNGPLSISVSSYCIDPADLDLIIRAAADAACKAFAAMDPDMDGDIDVPGADAEDTDHDAGESAPAAEVTETSPPDTAPEPVAEPQEDKEVPVVTDTATAVEASPAAATDPKVIAEAVEAALAKRDADRKAAKKAAAKAAAKAAGKAAETAAAGTALVTETDDQRIARIVEEKAAARLKAEIPAAVAETEDQRIERLVEARVTAEKQRLVAEGQVVPARKGVNPAGEVNEHTARVGTAEGEAPPAPPGKSWDEMHKWSTEELNQYATPGLADYVFGGRAGSIG